MEIDYKSLTKVTQQDLDEGVWDAEHKGLYSKDGKRFLQYIRPKELEWGQPDSFTFKSGVEVICEEAFSKYHSPLESLTIPESVVAIGDEAFQQVRLSQHSSITITKGLKYIGYHILGNFHGIIDLIIEEGITEIDLGHILDCAPATTLYLPSTLESISEEGFGECDGTEHIHLAEGNIHFRVENGILYDYSKTTLLRCPITKRGELRIPEGITTIGANALRLSGFPDAIDAEPEPQLSVILPQSLTKIKEGAFRHTWIDSLYIPENVSEIEEGAFENANHLIIEVSPNNQFFEIRNNLLIDKREMKVLFGMSNNVEIPNDIKSIANYAFRHLEPKSIVIPEGVTRIGIDNLNLNTLMHVILPSTLQRLTRSSFGGQIGFTEEPLVIEVPFGMGEKFKKKLNSDDGYYLSSNIKEKQEVKVENKSWNDAKQKNLERFLHAQDSGGIYDGTGTYAEALQEVKNGHKRGHWIWYVFPQMKGLGKSEISQFYGINGREEAKAYIEHPILRERLVEICEAVLNNEKSVYEIFGNDAIKVRSCVLLFESISDISVFKQIKSKYRW
jgi:uncharacterized protein (DUF1810 family)